MFPVINIVYIVKPNDESLAKVSLVQMPTPDKYEFRNLLSGYQQ